MLVDGIAVQNHAQGALPDFLRAQALRELPGINRFERSPPGKCDLADIVDHLACECQARGLLVLRHSSDAPPEIIGSAGIAAEGSPQHERFHAQAKAAAEAMSRYTKGNAGQQFFADGAFNSVAMALDDGQITITASFSEIGGAAAARWRDRLALLLPVLKPFFAQWLETQRALGRLQSMQQAMQISGAAILMLGASAEIIYANAAAEKILAARDGLRRAGDRLACGSFADTLRLQAALDQFKSQCGQEKGLSPVLALARAGRRPLTFALASALPSDSALNDEVKAIAYVFDPEEDLTGIVEPACRLYHLSHRETKLTCALVEGMSLAEAAGRLGLQEQTARSYLKQIFSKTATKRQAELVQLMLKSAVRFASGGRTQAFA